MQLFLIIPIYFFSLALCGCAHDCKKSADTQSDDTPVMSTDTVIFSDAELRALSHEELDAVISGLTLNLENTMATRDSLKKAVDQAGDESTRLSKSIIELNENYESLSILLQQLQDEHNRRIECQHKNR